MGIMEEIFMGIGICVVAGTLITLGFSLIGWLYKRYIGDPVSKRKARIEAMEKLAFEQALELAKLEPKQGDMGYRGVCKAGFEHMRIRALRTIGTERFEDKIKRIRDDVEKNGKPTYSADTTYAHD